MEPKLRWREHDGDTCLYLGHVKLGYVIRAGAEWWYMPMVLGGYQPPPENTHESAMAELERISREMLREAAGE